MDHDVTSCKQKQSDIQNDLETAIEPASAAELGSCRLEGTQATMCGERSLAMESCCGRTGRDPEPDMILCCGSWLSLCWLRLEMIVVSRGRRCCACLCAHGVLCGAEQVMFVSSIRANAGHRRHPAEDEH